MILVMVSVLRMASLLIVLVVLVGLVIVVVVVVVVEKRRRMRPVNWIDGSGMVDSMQNWLRVWCVRLEGKLPPSSPALLGCSMHKCTNIRANAERGP